MLLHTTAVTKAGTLTLRRKGGYTTVGEMYIYFCSLHSQRTSPVLDTSTLSFGKLNQQQWKTPQGSPITTARHKVGHVPSTPFPLTVSSLQQPGRELKLPSSTSTIPRREEPAAWAFHAARAAHPTEWPL